MSQKKIFESSEGNSYFQRNKGSAINYGVYRLAETLSPIFHKSGNKILEIGCGEGKALNYLSDKLNAAGYGIDPSDQAIKSGGENYPKLNLSVGTADKLGFDKYFFDLVFFGFCLYLVDRDDLFLCVYEADRVLRLGGFIAILDFDSAIPMKRKYKHKEGVYSYKSQYEAIFLASKHHTLVSKWSFSHENEKFAEDRNERISVTLLYKEPCAYIEA